MKSQVHRNLRIDPAEAGTIDLAGAAGPDVVEEN